MSKKKAVYLRIYEENPEMRKIDRIVETLQNDGVIIYPTDTIYAMGCSLFSARAIERMSRIKGVKPGKAVFSLIGYDISQLSDYTKNFTTQIYRVIKKGLPGPFTFILPAGNKIPKILHAHRKTIGIRVPDNNIPRIIAGELGHPLITTSIHDEDEVVEYVTDPEFIREKFDSLVDIIIDAGFGKNVASTIVDCTGDEFEVIRQGLGDFNDLL